MKLCFTDINADADGRVDLPLVDDMGLLLRKMIETAA